MMDSTASIGLENGHKLADVIFLAAAKAYLDQQVWVLLDTKNLQIKQSKDFC